MNLQKFGSFYINLDQITYVHRFSPAILPANAVPQDNVGGVRIGLGNGDLTIYEDEAGFESFMAWLEEQSGEWLS